jgi:hypothetical protein
LDLTKGCPNGILETPREVWRIEAVLGFTAIIAAIAAADK